MRLELIFLAYYNVRVALEMNFGEAICLLIAVLLIFYDPARSTKYSLLIRHFISFKLYCRILRITIRCDLDDRTLWLVALVTLAELTLTISCANSY